MKILTDYRGLRHLYERICIGLGNFDGVHLGHQQLISQLVESARKAGGTAVVFTFEPHPAVVLKPETAPPLLLAPELKQRMIAAFGVDLLLAVPFSREFAMLTPDRSRIGFCRVQLHVRTPGGRYAGNPYKSGVELRFFRQRGAAGDNRRQTGLFHTDPQTCHGG